MTDAFFLAARSTGSSPVLLSVFFLGGVVALWSGVSWAFDIRGITTRRAERIRQRNADMWATTGQLGGSPSIFAAPGYLRFLGALMAVAGMLMLLVTYALWHLG
ncbi:hypothetical protein [Streptomyces sp. NBC_00076]|uniref:hypothetical protein n=1 Tax=Streptomyces sp. NBC_00076 TaxID=2975642 RepID=UPI0032484811